MVDTRVTKKARQDTGGDDGAEISCASCGQPLTAQPFLKLIDGRGTENGCPHRVCVKCFGHSHALRGANIKICCGGKNCSYESRRWEVHGWDVGRSRRTLPEEQEICKPTTLDDKRRHPHLFYTHQPEDYRKIYSVLSLCTVDPNDPAKSRSFTSHLRVGSNNHEIDDSDMKSLRSIGRALHPSLIPDDSHDLYSKSTEAFADLSSITDLESQDATPLRQFMHGIATGDEFTQEEGRRVYQQKEHNAVFVATDILRTAKGGGPRGSRFKDLMTNHLNVTGSNEHMKKLLTYLGLSRSKTFLAISQDTVVARKISEGWSVLGKGYGIIIGAYDNIGFRKRTGYVQFIMMCILFYPVAVLIELKIYPDPKKDIAEAKAECLSRDRIAWEDISALEPGHEGFYQFEITKDDALLLAKEVTLPSIEYVLYAMKEGLLPTLQQAREYLDREDNTILDTDIPRSATARRRVPEGAEMNIAEMSLAEEQLGSVNNLDDDYLDDNANNNGKTIYDINNCTVDKPFPEDLNSTQGVMGVVNYYTALADRCLSSTLGCNVTAGAVLSDNDSVHDVSNRDDENTEDDVVTEGNPWAEAGWPPDQWPIPWMQSTGPYICGDGSPTFAMIRLKENDERYQHRRFVPLNGGFHTALETHKMRGKMFGQAHMRTIWAQWRASTAQLDWVMNPGDPNQVEDEMKMYYLAKIEAVILALMEYRKEKGESDDVGNVSTMDVYNFLTTEGTKSPIAHEILTEMRFAEVVFLLHQAEEESNATKFVTGLKFASLLYVGNHCTKYVKMCTDFLVNWHCSSEADRVVFEKLVMTRTTKAGKKIYMDRFVEWLVRDMRGGVGKFFRTGTTNALERQALLIDLKKQFTTIFKSDMSESEDTHLASSRKLGNSFCQSLVFFHDNKVFIDRTATRMSITEDSENITPEMLDMPVTCEANMDEYICVNKKNVNIDDKERQKCNARLLKGIHPTVQKQEENDKANLERCISTTKAYLMNNYTANELKIEYNRLKGVFSDDDTLEVELPLVEKPKNKPEHCDAIIKAREILIKHIRDWKDREQQRIRDGITSRNTSAADGVADRLKSAREHAFYHLHVQADSDLGTLYSTKYNVSTSSSEQVAQQGGLSQESSTSAYDNIYDLDL